MMGKAVNSSAATPGQRHGRNAAMQVTFIVCGVAACASVALVYTVVAPPADENSWHARLRSACTNPEVAATALRPLQASAVRLGHELQSGGLQRLPRALGNRNMGGVGYDLGPEEVPKPDEPEAPLESNSNDNSMPEHQGYIREATGMRVPLAKSFDEPADLQPTFTQQRCFLASDESEPLCIYDNVMCFDGKNIVVVGELSRWALCWLRFRRQQPRPGNRAVEKPTRDPAEIDDYSATCADLRYYDPSSLEDNGCRTDIGAVRGGVQRPGGAAGRQPLTDFPLQMGWHRWGPYNRNGHLFVRELPPDVVLSGTSNDQIKDEFLRGAPDTFDGKVVESTVSADGTVIHWLAGSLWLTGLEASWTTNPFHWMTKIGALFDAQRQNATKVFGDHPDDGYIMPTTPEEVAVARSVFREPRSTSRLQFKYGSQWDIPSMDTLIFSGVGSEQVANRAQLASWFAETLTLGVQPTTKVMFADALSVLSPHNMVCSRQGVVVGGKFRVFNGRADAAVWRLYAHAVAGLGTVNGVPTAHPLFPPRMITVLLRSGDEEGGREFTNLDEVLSTVRGTGLPYRVASNLGRMTFQEQVRLMATTGILVAAHGAALANIMHMPAHAAVIEIFPYKMFKSTYANLAHVANLQYTSVRDRLAPSLANHPHHEAVRLLHATAYQRNCAATNASSFHANILGACNGVVKQLPITVPRRALADALADAIDDIGAFNMANPEWARIHGAQRPDPA